MGNGGAQISLLGGFGSHFLAKIETVIPLERSIKSGYRNGNFHGRSKKARYFFINGDKCTGKGEGIS